jgi:pyridoxine kinase
MGDQGKLYSGLTQEHVSAVRALCCKADVLIPNVTEGCLLTGMDYRENADLAYYRQLVEGLRQLGADTVILTGIAPQPGMIGYLGYDKTLGEFSRIAPRQPKKCHGTGDLFAAVFMGGCVLGKPVNAAAEAAAEFVETVVSGTPSESVFGVEFEPHLHLLTLENK